MRVSVATIGFAVIPKMVGLHGEDRRLQFVKHRYLGLLRVWAKVMLFGPIMFDSILILWFIAYSMALGIMLSEERDTALSATQFGEVTVFSNGFPANLVLFCMAFMDTSCEPLYYDAINME